jgi:quercetin dioxygenase-like cupin family protein
MHTHDYDVTVKAIGGTGPAIENEDRIIIAAEGDTAFIPKKLRHASTDTHNFGRKVIAIYIDPEPAGMKPW